MKCPLCNNPVVIIDKHHLIPQSRKGGREGPLVKICPTCHTSIHRLQKNPHKTDEFLAIVNNGGNLKLAKFIISTLQKSDSLQKSDFVRLNVKVKRELHHRLITRAKDCNCSLEQILNSILSQVLS
jgi:hypothetical protein